MRAIALDAFGPAEDLALRELPEPKVGPDSVLIRVKAAGVNPVDAQIRQGALEPRSRTTSRSSRAGTSPAWSRPSGPAVVDLEPGDEVYAYARKTEIAEGTYAELVSLPAGMVARKPRKLSFAEAAAIPLAGLTAYQALTEALGVVRHETLLGHRRVGRRRPLRGPDRAPPRRGRHRDRRARPTRSSSAASAPPRSTTPRAT
jgi:NADPH:quinone reductase-like Zn-dependent oxidoreductase